MSSFIVLENTSPNFVSVEVVNAGVVSTVEETYTLNMSTDEMTLLSITERGPAGPQGPAGPPGQSADDLTIPDLSLIFEGALY